MSQGRRWPWWPSLGGQGEVAAVLPPAVPREGRAEDVTDRCYGKGIFINFPWPSVQYQLIFMGNLIQESNLT